jgi:hypothetical protein
MAWHAVSPLGWSLDRLESVGSHACLYPARDMGPITYYLSLVLIPPFRQQPLHPPSNLLRSSRMFFKAPWSP